MMKNLVTGATGLIGSTIVRELIKDGEDVRVLVRKTSDTRNIDNLEVEKVYGDIRDGDSMAKALKGIETLYYTAAHFSHWVPDKKIPYEINVEGTKTSMAAALKAGVQKVVYTSTNNTMGAHGAEKPADETAEFNHWDTHDHYSISKYLGEIEAKKFAAQGLSIVIVNPTIVIGARDIKPTPSGQLILAVAKGEMPGYVEGGVNIIDVEDVARGQIRYRGQHNRRGRRLDSQGQRAGSGYQDEAGSGHPGTSPDGRPDHRSRYADGRHQGQADRLEGQRRSAAGSSGCNRG